MRDDIDTAARLLQRVAALLGACKIEFHAHDVSDDVLASMLVAGGNVHQLTDGMHVATLEEGRLAITAYGRPRPEIKPGETSSDGLEVIS